ncbi:MAG: hypothetical protein RSB71_04480, partial [Bacilli bacterium]
MLFILSIIPFIIYVIMKSKKSFQMLQQNWYDDDHRYLKWMMKNSFKVFMQLDIFIVGIILFKQKEI